jgi:hypothetical protein
VRELISKLVAGGLSAAVVLLWWPQFFPADTVTAWLVRGVIWTLSFELLLAALGPVEHALWDTPAGRRVRSRASAAGDRIGSPRRSGHGRAMLACSALAVPLTLLAMAPPQAPKPKPATSVRHVTEVKRIIRVVRRPVQVAQVTPAQAPSVAPRVVADPVRTTERHRVSAPVRRTPSRPAPASPSTGTKTPSQAPVAANPPAGSTSTTPAAGGKQQTASLPRRGAVRRTPA